MINGRWRSLSLSLFLFLFRTDKERRTESTYTFCWCVSVCVCVSLQMRNKEAVPLVGAAKKIHSVHENQKKKTGKTPPLARPPVQVVSSTRKNAIVTFKCKKKQQQTGTIWRIKRTNKQPRRLVKWNSADRKSP